ncbi:glycoside hydrolase family 61 protein [Ceratobasidium sp. AG-Ba]|nr:glycoside hydrolase family 61 protein [Ceratobasidium sp. AG-Ba]
MKFFAVAAALASASTVYGHTRMAQIFVNGVAQGMPGFGSYIRNVQSNSPVKDLSSKDYICNVDGAAAPKTIEVSGGDVITMQWFHDSPLDDIIDHTHKGPLMVYIAPTSSNGQGAVWTKIFNQGYEGDWATEKLIAAKGFHSITLPDLAAGEYLLRPEIVALHEGDTDFKANKARGAQYYMSCAQLKVVSSGSVKLTGGVDLNKIPTTDPGVLFNLYGGGSFSSYTPPGGPLSDIAVAGQLGIGPVPAAGSKPTISSTSAGSATSAAPSISASPSGTVIPTTSAAQSSATPTPPSATSVVSTSRAPLPTSKFTTVTVRSSSTAAPTATACPTAESGSATGTIKKWYQCGGINYRGSTTCEQGTTCVVQNPYYSQCL